MNIKEQLEIAKAALKEYASLWKSEEMPTERDLEKDYDCGCCSDQSAGARAFKALKEIDEHDSGVL